MIIKKKGMKENTFTLRRKMIDTLQCNQVKDKTNQI